MKKSRIRVKRQFSEQASIAVFFILLFCFVMAFCGAVVWALIEIIDSLI